MAMIPDELVLPITDASQVGEARRVVSTRARALGFDEVAVGRVAIVATELAANLSRHAREGELLARSLRDGIAGIELIALDRGPGISDIGRALEDGHSTAGTAGTGLGAVKRLSDRFAIHSTSGGTVVMAELHSLSRAPAGAGPAPLAVGAVSIGHPGETVSGDAWAVRQDGRLCSLLVCDGLGHGPSAAEASAEAVRIFMSHRSAPEEAVTAMHAALAHTRGAAVAVAEIDRSKRVVRWSGVGNISGTIVLPGGVRRLVSHNGTVGHNARKIQEVSYPWDDRALLIAHSDGLVSHWRIEDHPGLAAQHPALIAATLYRDHKRPRDDVTVVVVSGASAP